MILAGITGKAGAGKDTVADYLVREHGFLKLSFAGPLKEMLEVAGLPEPTDRAAKELLIEGFSFTWREAAQRLGTEWGRGLDPEIWVKVMEMKLQSMRIPRVVFSDVRFENEAAMIRRLGGKVLHVTGRAAELGANARHASEAGIAFRAGDHVIVNDSTIEALFLQLHYTVLEGLK
jgi:dephospho-CoA kinase